MIQPLRPAIENPQLPCPIPVEPMCPYSYSIKLTRGIIIVARRGPSLFVYVVRLLFGRRRAGRRRIDFGATTVVHWRRRLHLDTLLLTIVSLIRVVVCVRGRVSRVWWSGLAGAVVVVRLRVLLVAWATGAGTRHPACAVVWVSTCAATATGGDAARSVLESGAVVGAARVTYEHSAKRRKNPIKMTARTTQRTQSFHGVLLLQYVWP
jgi:hypothetical protein